MECCNTVPNMDGLASLQNRYISSRIYEIFYTHSMPLKQGNVKNQQKKKKIWYMEWSTAFF